jgi:hypothetical protein
VVTRRPGVALLFASLLAASAVSVAARADRLRIVDAESGRPIADAIVTAGGRERRTGADGALPVGDDPAGLLLVRAAGYLRAAVNRVGAAPTEIALAPFRPKAIYLSMYGVGSRTLRSAALDLVAATELNALVIDVKGDRGLIAYRSAIPTAADVGAQRVITISDLPALVADLHARGIYAIARIVVFKDEPFASARPELAVRGRNGEIFRDRESLSWTDPFSRTVWDYNIAVAVEAAAAGFDEIQFDYVRFPDAAGLTFAQPATLENRRAAIGGFLREARRTLSPWNVFLAADVFGYVCWNAGDTHIGQQLEDMVSLVDYVSPMLYPSSFQYGIPGFRNPVEHPFEIVARSLERALERTGVPPVRYRPWLQAFGDYAFDGRAFTNGEIRSQIDAAERLGSGGWMLWNPRNRYSAADLRVELRNDGT